MTIEQTSKRSHLLDTIKGIAIILVVLGHCIQFGSGMEYVDNRQFWYNPIFRCIYSFHMPLFAIISGYLMYLSIQKRSFFSYTKKQVLYFVPPLVSWAIISWGHSMISSTELSFTDNGKSLIFDLFIKLMSGLWFIRIFLLCSILIALVVCYIKVKKYQIVTFVLIWAISLFIPDIFGYNRATYLFPYFVVGYFLFESKIRWQKLLESWFVAIMCCVVFFVLLIWFKSEYIYAYYPQATYVFQTGYSFTALVNQMFVNCYRWLIGFWGSASVIALCCKSFGNKDNIIAFVGLYTLPIYIVSSQLNTTILLYLTRNCHYNLLLCILECSIMISLLIIFSRWISRNEMMGRLLGCR